MIEFLIKAIISGVIIAGAVTATSKTFPRKQLTNPLKCSIV